MSQYSFPDLTDREILYKGRRFKVFAVSKDRPFDGHEDDFNFVVWDGLYDAAVACGTVSSKGIYSGVLAFSQVEIEIESAKDISSFIKNVRKEQLGFFKATSTA